MNVFRQRGMTLVELMVAMLIMLLTVGAMLMTYRIMVGTSIPATRSAQREGQTASALLAMQIELQQAGYGIEEAEGSNIEASADGRRIVWRYRETLGAATFQCAGLFIDTVSRGIFYLTPQVCVNTDASMNFATSRLIASEAVFEAPGDEARSYTLAGATFAVTAADQTCGPFGIAVDGRRQVFLRDVSDADNPITIFSYCLTNS